MKWFGLPVMVVCIAGWCTACSIQPVRQKDLVTFVLSDTMLASIRIDTTAIKPLEDSARESLPAIPSSAIITENGRSFVIVFRDKFNVDKREVRVAATRNNISYIREGLGAGECVISGNQLPIYHALNK